MINQTAAYSLITGASKGIGKALALECARQGWNLALVSLPGEGLSKLAAEIRDEFGRDVKYLETDLSQPGAAEAVYEWRRREGFPVNMLINNAGFGSLGEFRTTATKRHLEMLHLNMDTPYILTRLLLDELARHEAAYILNVSSQAAFFPIPYKATYSSTKAFLFFFSHAIQYELRGTGIHVSCVCPSGVYTSDAIRKRIEAAGMWSRMAALEPEAVARIAIRQTVRGKRLIVPGIINRLTYYLSRIFPRALSMAMAAKRFSREPEPLVTVNPDPEEQQPVPVPERID